MISSNRISKNDFFCLNFSMVSIQHNHNSKYLIYVARSEVAKWESTWPSLSNCVSLFFYILIESLYLLKALKRIHEYILCIQILKGKTSRIQLETI